MSGGEATFVIVCGGQVAIVNLVVILDLIAQRRDHERASHYEKPM